MGQSFPHSVITSPSTTKIVKLCSAINVLVQRSGVSVDKADNIPPASKSAPAWSCIPNIDKDAARRK